MNNIQLCYTVFDSSAKFPEGVLMGSLFQLGNFGECLEVNVNEDWGSFKGQHCVVTVNMNVSNYNLPHKVWHNSVVIYAVTWKQNWASKST
jgi:hypothetical protein